jgi:hypothetical protein
MFITFGIFNMVTAVFVENVIDSAKQRQLLSKEAERVRIGQLMTKFVMKVAQQPNEKDSAGTRTGSMITWGQLSQTGGTQPAQFEGDVTRFMFQRALEDPEVVRLVEDLDISVGDPSELFDAVDADGSGCIDVGELISGIMKLRCSEMKNDTVAIVLAMRHMRNTLQGIQDIVSEIKPLRGSHKSLSRHTQS